MKRAKLAGAALLLSLVGARDCDLTNWGSAAHGSTRSIACGPVTCTSVCCPTLGTCVTATSQCMSLDGTGTAVGAAMSCDGPEDCPTQEVCCASMSGTGNATTACALAAACANVSTQEKLCHSGDDCTAPATCGASALSGALEAGIQACH